MDYNTQVNQIPYPYYPVTPSGSNKRKAGLMLAGGLIGMNAYYMPVKKDVFVNKAFELTQYDALQKASDLEKIAEEVEKNKLSSKSKMMLEEMGLTPSVDAISAKCKEIKAKVTDEVSVKRIKEHYAGNFEKYKKNIALTDNIASDAFKAVKRSKFWWGTGIGAGIGLALGLMSSRN